MTPPPGCAPGLGRSRRRPFRWQPRRSFPTSLLARLALRTAVAGFAFFLLAGTAVVSVAARTTVSDVEDRLDNVATLVSRLAVGPDAPIRSLCSGVANGLPLPPAATREVVLEIREPDGRVCRASNAPVLDPLVGPRWPVRVITGSALPRVQDQDGRSWLVVTRELPSGAQLRVGGDLSTFSLLAERLVTTMVVISVPAALAAAFIGLVLTRGGLRPVRELANAAQTVARTQELSVALPVRDSAVGEVGRLTVAFNDMMAALWQARQRQAQLVADAGHELRTPLTSLRTNIELLARSEQVGRPLPAADRAALLTDVTAQLDELSELVGELVVLAHDPSDRRRVDVRLDEVVGRALERARRRALDRQVVVVELQPWVVPDADPDAVERAVLNLLDNAVKFSPPGSTVRISLRDGQVVVDDEGPGVPPQLRREVFARFWRGPDARGLPGSGLGLAIVADTADSHGGRAGFSAAPDGGGRAVIALPGQPAV
ncbi:MAG: HAMP domain-containing sensor histidine kinase [Angustibacter sp.]